MKNFLISLLLLIPSVLYADDVKIGILWYNLIDKAKVAEVTKCESSAVDVAIPSTVEYNGKTYKVERIRENAFKSISKLKSVQIPEGVVEICENAFSNWSLESVNIPNSVTTIGASAFWHCGKLSSPIILSNVERIENSTFNMCSSLTSVELSEKVKYIGRYAFSYCEKLESISIPKSVKTIDIGAFDNCYSLKSIFIPSSVTEIASSYIVNSFQKCESLESITVDPNNPFYDSRDNCNAIVDKRLNRIITGCKNTKIPNGIWEIGNDAFYGCTHLKSIEIPSSVFSIGSSAFHDCIELSSILFHGDVSEIGLSVFNGCKSLKSIDIPFDIDRLSTTFLDCTNLERITLPYSLTSLDRAFENCVKLFDVSFPESLNGFGSSFYNCTNIKTIRIPYGCDTKSIFENCEGLETVYLPSSTRDVWDSFQNCKALLDVYCYATQVPYTSDKTFKGSDIKYSTLYVPEESVEKYATASIWKDFGKIVGVKTQKISLDDALSKLQALQEICEKRIKVIEEIKGDDYRFIDYGRFLYGFQNAIKDLILKINNEKKADYYQIEHFEKLWNEVYQKKYESVKSLMEQTKNNMIYLTYKCNQGGKVTIGENYGNKYDVRNETKQFDFLNPLYCRSNPFAGFSIYAIPDDGYHVESFKVGGVEQIGVSDYSEEQLIYGLLRYNSLRFSYNDVEVVFASGESSIQTINAEGRLNHVYSINGMKVRENTSSLEGLPKGIYIVNGKKVIIK